jgi:hypothetical protein
MKRALREEGLRLKANILWYLKEIDDIIVKIQNLEAMPWSMEKEMLVENLNQRMSYIVSKFPMERKIFKQFKQKVK